MPLNPLASGRERIFMFCIKCGKPNDDDAMFCEFCGAQISDPEESRQSVPAYAPTTAAPAAPIPAPAPKKRGKGGIIAVIVSSAAVVIAAVIVVVLVLNKRSEPKTDPVLKGEPTLTVNGKDVPVSLAMMDNVSGKVSVFITGKSDGEAFRVIAGFSNEPKSNTKFNASEFNDECFGGISYSGKGARVDQDGYYEFEICIIEECYIEIGQYVPNEYIEIVISGKEEYNGRTFDFKAGGKVNFNADLDRAYTDWLIENRIPANDNE